MRQSSELCTFESRNTHFVFVILLFFILRLSEQLGIVYITPLLILSRKFELILVLMSEEVSFGASIRVYQSIRFQKDGSEIRKNRKNLGKICHVSLRWLRAEWSYKAAATATSSANIRTQPRISTTTFGSRRWKFSRDGWHEAATIHHYWNHSVRSVVHRGDEIVFGYKKKC